jgi:hypothetical protein
MNGGNGHKPVKNNSPVEFMINGNKRRDCDNGCNSGGIATADGGFYVYTPATDNVWWTSWTGKAKPANCGGTSTPQSGCTTVAREEMFSPAAGSCYKYTPTENYDCKVRAFMDGYGSINLDAKCSGQTYSGNIGGYNWTELFNCGIGNEVTINVNSVNNNAKMKMSCW